MQKLDTGGLESGVKGHALPSELTIQVEKRFLRWLNDEWPSGDHCHVWMDLAGPAKSRVSSPDCEDEGARERVVKTILPLLQTAQSATDDWGGKQTKAQMVGLWARAALNGILGEYTLLQTAPVPGSPGVLLVTGHNATEAWGAYTLCLMARNGRLSKLARCACERPECQKWIIAWRSIDKYASAACRVKASQAGPEFKAKRAARARRMYADQKERDRSALKPSGKGQLHAKA